MAEGGGLLNRYTLQRRIEGSNPSGSANFKVRPYSPPICWLSPTERSGPHSNAPLKVRQANYCVDEFVSRSHFYESEE